MTQDSDQEIKSQIMNELTQCQSAISSILKNLGKQKNIEIDALLKQNAALKKKLSEKLFSDSDGFKQCFIDAARDTLAPEVFKHIKKRALREQDELIKMRLSE